MIITKNEFISRMAKKTGQTVSQTKDNVNAFIDTLEEVCAESDGICFTGFGTFSKRVRKGRAGEFNGKSYQSKDTNYVHFKMGSLFSRKLNDK